MGGTQDIIMSCIRSTMDYT